MPTARVVSAFNTVPKRSAFWRVRSPAPRQLPTLVYCGDEKSGTIVASGLIREVGFDPVHAGPLQVAGYSEPFPLRAGNWLTRDKAARSWRTVPSGFNHSRVVRS
jgi:predicted dinucleotide-binding enzyme